MARRARLFRYFDDKTWAEAFVDGSLRFRALSHFRGIEDQGVRGDRHEGVARFAPEGGLEINNLTQGTRFTMPAQALASRVRADEILVFCASRAFSRRLWTGFGAAACVEIADVAAFCRRVAARLPQGAQFSGPPGRERFGQRVEYYNVTDAADTRWALPDRIARSKLDLYRWQDEFRLIFSTTGALDFQNLALTIEPREAALQAGDGDRPFLDIAAGSLRDICRIHETPPDE